MVEAWRRAACAAVEGLERDLPDLHGALDLTSAERTDLARDVVAVTEALLILDDRYVTNTPGWTRVCPATPRAAATFACMKVRVWLPELDPVRSWSIDDRGHTPPAVTDGPEPSPVRAAAALARTLPVDPPSAGALRRCVHQLSRAAGRLAEHATTTGEDEIAEAMTARVRSYAHLQGALRNVGALHTSTTAAQHAIDLDQLLASTPPHGDDLHALATTWARIDAALGQRLLDAIGDGTYLGTWTTRLEARPSGAIRRARPYFEHLTAANHPELLTAAARLARPPTLPVPVPAPAATCRHFAPPSTRRRSGP